MWKYNRSKPVIGIAGGIGSGKSTIARMFGDMGCAVIDSDALAREALETPFVKNALRVWLGESVVKPDGSIDRKAVAAKVFSDPVQIKKLNALVHPLVKEMRDERMPGFMADPKVKAIVWDTPLLFEVGYDQECDVIVFVKVPREERLSRLAARRGWDAGELDRREKLQFPLDKKESVADYCIDNSNSEASSITQARHVFSQILATDSN